jgi:hypothetical protein
VHFGHAERPIPVAVNRPFEQFLIQVQEAIGDRRRHFDSPRRPQAADGDQVVRVEYRIRVSPDLCGHALERRRVIVGEHGEGAGEFHVRAIPAGGKAGAEKRQQLDGGLRVAGGVSLPHSTLDIPPAEVPGEFLHVAEDFYPAGGRGRQVFQPFLLSHQVGQARPVWHA